MLLTYKFEVKVNKTLGIILGHLSYASSKLFNVAKCGNKAVICGNEKIAHE